MRITIYEKGGNSLNPFIKLSFFLIIILCLFVIPVSAFEDDFDDTDITDWDINSGVWSGLDGTLTTSALNANIERSVSDVNPRYFKFDMLVPAGSTRHYFTFRNDGVTTHRVKLAASVATLMYGGASQTDITGLSTNTWYTMEITESGSNYIFEVTDRATGVSIDTKTVGLGSIGDSTKISVHNDLISGTTKIDNIFISPVSPSQFTSIDWAMTSYTVGDNGVYSWVIESDFWSFLYKHRVQILKNGVEVDSVSIGQTGIRYYDFNDVGAYVVKIQYSGYIFTNWISLDSDGVTVLPEIDSYINVPSTSAIKTNFTTTYLYGSTPISPIINIKVLQNDYTYKVIDTKILPSATAGTTYTINLSISSLSSIGYYVVELYDNGQGKSFATDTIQTTYAYIPPSDIIGSSYVNTTNIIYSLGGVISGSYAIDDTNYTDYYTKLQVYNIDKDIISFSFIPLHQVDNFDIPITNSELDFYSDGVNRYPISTNFLSGENAVRLASYNTDGSLNEVITQKNITLSIINNEGYGLTLSKYTVDETEIFAIKAITPVQASIVIHPLTLMGISDTTILINGSTQMSYAIGIADTYTISLVSGGETKITQIIKVFESEEIIAPIDEDIVIPDTTFQDNTTSLLNSPYLMGLFIMCVFLAIGATNGIGGTIVTGSIGLGIVCYMGIFPWILLVIEVLVVAVLMAKGMINLSGD